MLQFSESGKFAIVHLCDLQDVYPMNKTTCQFVVEVLREVQPDLVVLGGDNTVAEHDDIPAAIRELCDLFVEAETCFTLVFGNHDNQHGYSNDELFAYYKEFGGEFCLAYDAVPKLTGTATHNLPILSSDGSRVAFNLFLFDSNTYSFENGVELGYDCVHKDQIEWYRKTSAALKDENNGKAVPAMAFQHIVVREACDALFFKAGRLFGKFAKRFNGATYTVIPKLGNLKSGYLFEFPCPGFFNFGQMDAMVETGDVIAVFSGHDHTNNFTVKIDGIDVVNTAGCTYHSYGNSLTRGCRVIELNEKEATCYSSRSLTVAEMALRNGSAICGFGDVTKTKAFLTVCFNKVFSVFVRLLSGLFFFAK